ncbi:HAD family hydrolase [Ktedonobacter robiniae]|uniref:Haloacid dehalogenase n=1 Tax=Ktedonobacter robiniae TaxID=2778365 RepID=A0ABQ3UM68_9CHLR|nr:HAD family hydrolase [Ktedonobacter robiniae]GHO53846.1 haloacid dehalogenase [Ktedonobacter robiniae]
MSKPGIWRRPGLQFPPDFDSIFFDVDGILIHTLESFHATDIATAEYIVGTLHGLDWGQHEGKALLTSMDVDIFKQAGGYNNDWDMCYLLASLYTAKLREWRGTELAERSNAQWAALSREANLHGHGGRTWVEETIPARARADYAIIGDIYHEYYWGGEGMRKYYGQEMRYLPSDFAGLYHREHMLYQPDFFQRLRAAGIKHMGMITGRVGPEVESALERMEAYSGERWWEVVIPADICPKPNPQALRMAIERTGARAGLFIGDTADDHDFVRKYMQGRTPGEPIIIGAMSVNPAEVDLYKQRGAEIIVPSVEDLLDILPEAVK